MLSISHGLSGAFLATSLVSPVFFVPACLAVHYLEDWIPHWDVGTGLSTGKRSKKAAILMELVELGLMFGAIYWFWGPATTTTFWLAIMGAMVALLPDFMEAPRNFLNWEPAFLTPLNNFHNRFHHSIHNFAVGLTPQVVTVIAIYLLK
jgi:uncharacterized membrane protein YbaN (DUF454 family)